MRATIQTGRHPDGHWLLATRPSAAPVRRLVPAYVGYDERAMSAVRRLEVPHPHVTLIINIGEPIRVGVAHDAGAMPAYGSFVAGVFETAVATENTGIGSGIELNLTPLVAWQLLRVPMTALANRIVSLGDLLGNAAIDLESALHDSADWDTRFDLLDGALTARRCSAPEVPTEVAWAWTALTGPGGGATITSVADALGWSRRRLGASFREHVGMTPKLTSRISRFDHAARLVRAGRGQSLSRLALHCGYADQAHFTREFREFSGLTPLEFQRRVRPGAAGISPE